LPPQLAADGVWQTPLASQQPFGHEVALQAQAPPEQPWPPAQVAHCLPPEPQASGELPGWQTPLGSQQPLGHDVASQLQLPLAQSWPLAQAEQVAPPLPHELAVCDA
jgi:hypothetical protein